MAKLQPRGLYLLAYYCSSISILFCSYSRAISNKKVLPYCAQLFRTSRENIRKHNGQNFGHLVIPDFNPLIPSVVYLRAHIHAHPPCRVHMRLCLLWSNKLNRNKQIIGTIKITIIMFIGIIIIIIIIIINN